MCWDAHCALKRKQEAAASHKMNVPNVQELRAIVSALRLWFEGHWQKNRKMQCNVSMGSTKQTFPRIWPQLGGFNKKRL